MLVYVLYGFIGLTLVTILIQFFEIPLPLFPYIDFYYPLFVLWFFILAYKSLNSPEIFQKLNAMKLSKAQYEKSGLSKDDLKLLKSRLLLCMERQKPHLDGSLNLTLLAKILRIPPHQLTQLLNLEIGCNFYNFINSYRVEEVKSILLSYEYEQKSVLEIAFACGFNSKAAFNSAFRKFTGKTPTQFRKEQSTI